MVQRPPAGTIPDAPGSYQFKDIDGRVIYVGKAKSLRSRLSNYFGSPALLLFSPRQGAAGANYLGVPLAVDLIGAQGVAVLTSGGGTATHHMALPADPALLGRRFYAQWLVRDRGVTPRISATRGAEFELFAR